ncbi:flavin reductase family protein [Nesterenkonia alkaliphila]|uniref:Flavin reductase family protein n=1 Tax=Nesterenkonia alkaliphila TaxID=1463631 RepID=A0A7K1UH63_9MICC|nr:flavin reductase family protein [Nesterenkonia alkaliphila]MVT25752.1 flavin reductase family protein [Nesterenkonia alkaliphila]GFZ92992.1 Asp/Glu/hydantoin racemase [Nesterenkonia alkaliphila]
MSSEYHFYEPGSGHGLPHSPFNAIIAPRPIGWISSQDAQGVLNLAPYSFFNAFNYTPPIIGFASNGAKDTLANAEATGEFCWNLVSEDLAEQMNATSAEVAADVDEFELAGLTPAPSQRIRVPHVAEARAVFECRTTQIVPLVTANGEATVTQVVFGEVIGVHIHKTLLSQGVYQTTAGKPVVRGGGPSTYFRVQEDNRLEMHRPALPRP